MGPDHEFSYALKLLTAGPDRRRTMALLRKLRPEISPAGAKALVDTAPVIVMSDISFSDRHVVQRMFNGIADVELIDLTLTPPKS